MIATQQGHLEIVRELLETKNINVNLAMKYGITALMIATQQGHLEIVKALVKAGADLDVKYNGKTLIQITQEALSQEKDTSKIKAYNEIIEYINKNKEEKLSGGRIRATDKEQKEKLPNKSSQESEPIKTNKLAAITPENNQPVEKELLVAKQEEPKTPDKLITPDLDTKGQTGDQREKQLPPLEPIAGKAQASTNADFIFPNTESLPWQEEIKAKADMPLDIRKLYSTQGVGLVGSGFIGSSFAALSLTTMMLARSCKNKTRALTTALLGGLVLSGEGPGLTEQSFYPVAAGLAASVASLGVMYGVSGLRNVWNRWRSGKSESPNSPSKEMPAGALEHAKHSKLDKGVQSVR